MMKLGLILLLTASRLALSWPVRPEGDAARKERDKIVELVTDGLEARRLYLLAMVDEKRLRFAAVKNRSPESREAWSVAHDLMAKKSSDRGGV